jgi:hypothetical protein
MRLRGKKPIFNVKDTWSLDSTLNPIIAEGLKKFKEVIMGENVAGYPQQVIDEFPNPLSTHAVPGLIEDEEYGVKRNPDYDKMDDEYFNKWIEIIDKMIYAFEDEKNAPEIPDNYLEMHISEEANENGYFPCEFEITDQEKYDNHKADDEEHHKKVQEGLDLFAKHYKSLWW